MWIVVASLAATAVATAIYNFLSGEHLLLDLADEARLARATLRGLDDTWSRKPRADVVISLTTIPSRLPHLDLTLKSLLRQSVAPARIELNLPAYSTREKSAYQVPERLRGLSALTIHEVEDQGPATKLLPALARHAPDQRIIVVDDDRVYPTDFVARLLASSDQTPDAAVTYGGWRVPADLVDRPTTLLANLRSLAPVPLRPRRLRRAARVDIVQGCAGYLVRPRFFDAGVADYSGAPPAARTVDDVWLSAHCRVPKYVIPAPRSHYQPKRLMALFHRTSLGLINRGPGPANQRANSIMLRHLADRW